MNSCSGSTGRISKSPNPSECMVMCSLLYVIALSPLSPVDLAPFGSLEK